MRTLLLIIIIVGLGSCQPQSDAKSAKMDESPSIEITKSKFGQIDDKTIDLYTLKNKNGMEVKITNYGGIITSIIVPDKEGQFDDVALGFNTLDKYLADHPFFGGSIGRYGNRIAGAKFSIDGKEYTLAANNGVNTLHGGDKGFDKQIWNPKIIDGGISLNRISPDMEEGFPGNLDVTVNFILTEDNAIDISYTATTDKKTICNLTNHSYFNLAGEGNGTILNHELKILADKYNPVDEVLIPTGIESVEGTPFDFNEVHTIGERVNAEHEQIIFGNGYDHNYILRKNANEYALAAVARDAGSGRVMEVFTSEPGVQFYCGNFLDGTIVGKRGNAYPYRGGICLETQHFPDSPNQSEFPSTILSPGDTYKTKTSYRFSVVN